MTLICTWVIVRVVVYQMIHTSLLAIPVLLVESSFDGVLVVVVTTTFGFIIDGVDVIFDAKLTAIKVYHDI